LRRSWTTRRPVSRVPALVIDPDDGARRPRAARAVMRPALAAAIALAACVPPRTPPAPASVDGPRYVAEDTVPAPVVRVWPAMGTMLEMSVWDADSTRALVAMDAARTVVSRVDSLVSRDLANVNRRAGADSAA